MRPTSLVRLLPLALVTVPAWAGAQDTFDRTRPPALGNPAPLVVPSVRTAPLGNGITVSVVEQRELPLVQVVATFDGGARLDGSSPGMASFVAGMLDEGAGTRDAVALQSELAYLGASLSTFADWDRVVVSLKVPLRTLSPALDLLADVVMRPTFAAAEVRRQRDLRLTTLLQRRDQPEALADLAFNHVVFPRGHPYHASTQGDSASTAALDSAAVRAFHARTVRPEFTRFVIVGDIADSTARAELQRRFGGWRASGPAMMVSAIAAEPRREAQTQLYLVDKPEAAQSVISIGWPGVDRHSPDYPALQVMNTLLGGSFSSRLMTNLREEKGYTYGARSAFSYRRAPGPFVASAAVRTDVTDSSLVEFFRELRAIRETPVSAVELDRARAYVELGLPGSLESTTQVANTIAQLATFDLPLSALTAYADRVRAVTAADVQRVARQYLTPDRATVVIVGDLAAIRAPVDALKLGAITVLDVKDVAR